MGTPIITHMEAVIQGGTLAAEAIVSYVETLIATWKGNSQATIDELHAAALSAANAEAPQGATPLT